MRAFIWIGASCCLIVAVFVAYVVSPIRPIDLVAPAPTLARATPKGQARAGTYDESYWTSPLARGGSAERTLEEALISLVGDLDPHKPFFDAFVADGGRAEFFVGWFIPAGNSGDLLDWRLLERLARLRIGLSLDIYPCDPSAEP